MPNSSSKVYKFAVMGEGGVGKTALVIQLCLNKFVETYDPTIEDSYRTHILLNGRPVTVELMDTAGQEEYAALREQWITEGEGFVVVYSVTDKQSFARIRQYFEEIARIKEGQAFGIVLIGNKIDESRRVVTRQQGKALAQKWKIPFFETSAKKNLNIESAFAKLVQVTQDSHEAFRAAAVQTPSAEGDSPDAPPQNRHNHDLSEEETEGAIPFLEPKVPQHSRSDNSEVDPNDPFNDPFNANNEYTNSGAYAGSAYANSASASNNAPANTQSNPNSNSNSLAPSTSNSANPVNNFGRAFGNNNFGNANFSNSRPEHSAHGRPSSEATAATNSSKASTSGLPPPSYEAVLDKKKRKSKCLIM